jgi:hypothetical protein
VIDPVYISAAVLVVNVGGIIFAVGAWKKQTEQVSEKLTGLEAAVGKRLDKLERGLEETSSALALRVSNVESNLHSLEIQITRDYVSRDVLTELKADLTRSIEKLETTLTTTIGQAMARSGIRKTRDPE